MSALLEVADLSVAYGETRVLDQVTFSLEAGEVLGIVGQSGSGKSTLALAVLGLLPVGARIVGGEVRLRGVPATRARQSGACAVAYVPQEPMSALNPTVRVGRQIDWILARRFPDRSRAVRRAQLEAALQRMRIDDPGAILRAYPFELSGGQLQRCLLAQALALEPDLIIADEPTTALDVTVQAEVLDLLELVAAETGAGILFITHNIAVVWRLCPRLLVLWRGKLVEAGETRTIVAHPAEAYTRALLDALPGRSGPRTYLPVGAVDIP